MEGVTRGRIRRIAAKTSDGAWGFPVTLLWLPLVAAVVATGSMPLVRLILRRYDIIDLTTERSSHRGVVPRGGGLAVICGAVVAVLAAVLTADIADRRGVGVVTMVAVGFGVVGFLDDIADRSVSSRLLAQIGLAVIMVSILSPRLMELPIAISAVLAALWMIAFVNAFNFMDGIDGISAVSTLVIGATLAFHAFAQDTLAAGVLAAAVAGAAMGFAPFNFGPSRVFLGDSGSYFLGAALAGSAVLVIEAGASPVAVLLPFALYAWDTSSTLVRRLRSGASPFQAHREHGYQVLANRRLGHLRTTSLVASITAAAAALGVWAGDDTVLLGISGALVGCFVAGYAVLAKRSTVAPTRPAPNIDVCETDGVRR